MIKLPKLFRWNGFDPFTEGLMAHEFKDDSIRKLITENYNRMHCQPKTPYTHPENYDPLNPPTGWAYDPYYEIWMKTE